ncbi:MAG: heme-copper oxidase subunit III [Longimicrobiaceae bacterium]
MSTRQQASIDVSGLPDVTYGYRNLVWWGTAAFMVIESVTLAMCAGTYLYLRRNFSMLPPARIELPELTLATLEVVLMLVSFLPLAILSRAAHRKDLPAVRLWLLVATAFNLAFVALRWFELGDLNVRWDQNAYGSSAWLVLIVHGTLVLAEVGELVVFSLIAWTGRWEEKHFPDTSDLVMYWYFMCLSWLPLYAMVFLLPRVM